MTITNKAFFLYLPHIQKSTWHLYVNVSEVPEPHMSKLKHFFHNIKKEVSEIPKYDVLWLMEKYV